MIRGAKNEKSTRSALIIIQAGRTVSCSKKIRYAHVRLDDEGRAGTARCLPADS